MMVARLPLERTAIWGALTVMVVRRMLAPRISGVLAMEQLVTLR